MDGYYTFGIQTAEKKMELRTEFFLPHFLLSVAQQLSC